MSGNTPRGITDAEFIDSFRRVVSRLDAHISMVDSGNLVLRDDLATVIRILLGRDKGNQGIRRLCRRFNLKERCTNVSEGAKIRDSVLLHVGALPFPKGRSLRVTSLLDEFVLFIVAGGKKQRYTWQRVIDDYGNTLGVHLPRSVPQLLDAVRYHGMGPTDFGTYLLRAIGVAASEPAHSLLSALDGTHTPIQHSLYLYGHHIGQVIYARVDGTDDIQVLLNKQDWDASGPVVSVRNPEGERVTFSIVDRKLALSVVPLANEAGPGAAARNL